MGHESWVGYLGWLPTYSELLFSKLIGALEYTVVCPSKNVLVVLILVLGQFQNLWLQCLHPHVNFYGIHVQSPQVFLHRRHSLFMTLCTAFDALCVLPPTAIKASTVVVHGHSCALPAHTPLRCGFCSCNVFSIFGLYLCQLCNHDGNFLLR